MRKHSENTVSIVGLQINTVYMLVSLLPLQMCLEFVAGAEAQGQL